MAQGYNTEKTALTNFLVRMYENAPFEGVRAVDDYEQQYLISVLTLEKAKYPNESAMFRVAGVKAMSQASRFFNGGGHLNAAGGRLECSLEEALQIAHKACQAFADYLK